VVAPRRPRARRRTCAGTTPERAAEYFREDVRRITIEPAGAALAELEPHAAGALPAAPCATESRERIPARAAEIGKARLSRTVDFAAVELAPLHLVTDDLIGLIDLCETVLGLRVIRVLVRMIFLCELAERRLDVLRRSVLRNAQDVIGIAHLSCL